MIPLVIRHYGLQYHCSADDIQLYLNATPTTLVPRHSLASCLQDIQNWMNTNFLKLSSKKTGLMVVGPKAQLQKVGEFFSRPVWLFYLSVLRSSQPQCHPPINLTLNAEPNLPLSSQKHLQALAFTFRTIAESLIHTYISSRLDSCNSLLFGLPTKAPERLQYIQNFAARVLTCFRHWQHITPTLKCLHWLLLKFCIS